MKKKKKKGLFTHLARNGIKNNEKLYKPYILASVGMTAMFYIIFALSEAPFLSDIPGGNSAGLVLSLGIIVVGVFAVIFMFYINSFLIRTRTKEFGLYNILGMSRRHIAKIVAIETLIAAGISISGGLLGGVLFEKLAEMLFARMIGEIADYSLSIDLFACGITAAVFLGIFLLVMCRSMFRIFRLKTIDLLKSENVGEKPPKAKWVLTLIGALLLGGAYYLAVAMAAPIQAVTMFFIAVIMVIIATYILFISGSVSLCRGLQKNKKYYYRADHFVSLSSMVFRMKRNGAGLASICILSTMVLVMISSTSCLYFGKDASLMARYPTDISYRVRFNPDVTNDRIAETKNDMIPLYQSLLIENGGRMSSVVDFTYTITEGLLKDGVITKGDSYFDTSLTDVVDVWDFYFVTTDDYNRYMGTDISLSDDEAIVCNYHDRYPYDTITTPFGKTYKITESTKDFFVFGSIASNITSASAFVVNKLPKLDTELLVYWEYGFDTGVGGPMQYEIYQAMDPIILGHAEALIERDDSYMYYISSDCRYMNRADFFGMYGGLFFLGITLSIIFICALVLILYYKQISEGYEDRARYDIMRKVGMSREDIKKNVNSQMGSVFYLPLLAAVIHLGFALPMIFGMLKLFSVTEVSSLLTTAAVSAVLFGVIYTIVYRITSNSYYKLVS